MQSKIKLYFQLMRFHKPVGILLLLWPTLCALWIAARGLPSIKNLFIFVSGVIIMRAAGCVINDIADRKFDLHVSRTQSRPITTDQISTHAAFILFFILCVIAFILVLFTNTLTILLAFFALATTLIYPLMKRYTHFPQVILGIAFSFSIPMAFAAEINQIHFMSLLFMFITILWTVMYDTEYAMADRADDLKIGIKSTAIFFGKYDRVMIGIFQISVILLLFFFGLCEKFSVMYFIAIFIAALLFVYQQFLIATREPQKCLRAFINNQWVGFIVFLGIFLKS